MIRRPADDRLNVFTRHFEIVDLFELHVLETTSLAALLKHFEQDLIAHAVDERGGADCIGIRSNRLEKTVQQAPAHQERVLGTADVDSEGGFKLGHSYAPKE